ncbi:hypothetical protein LTR97_003674 [Elasticomyces elasticus]|uniref:C2H2-type domain-containing protein n=1 Tax=Elasticomyces elasticus TaxID=574655 RepID=A0AAN7W8D1_9PEZI|nr:hypothetical protein LTR97_003674 [Elasticomyces elasticus]
MFTTLNDIQELADVVVSTSPVLSPYNSDEEPSDYYSDEDPIADNGMDMRDMDTRLDSCETPVAGRSHRRAPSIPVAHSVHGHHHAGTPQNTTARDETHAAMAVNSASTSFDSAAHRVSTPDTHYSSDSNDLSQSEYGLMTTQDRSFTFGCPICPKGFNRSHELGMHILAHEDICHTFDQAHGAKHACQPQTTSAPNMPSGKVQTRTQKQQQQKYDTGNPAGVITSQAPVLRSLQHAQGQAGLGRRLRENPAAVGRGQNSRHYASQTAKKTEHHTTSLAESDSDSESDLSSSTNGRC